MKGSRIIYGEMIILLFVCWIITDRVYLLWMFAIAVITILLCGILLVFDTYGLELKSSMRSSCQNGKTNEIIITLNKKRQLLIAGNIDITVEFYNSLLDATKTEMIHIPLRRKEKDIMLYYDPSCCGEVYITMKKTTCSDLLDLFDFSIKNADDLIVTVHPANHPIAVYNMQQQIGNVEGGEHYQNKRGNDISEIYDMKEYTPGDDIRSIHWKLSSKTDSLLTRIGSNVTHFYTMMLLDIGLEIHGERCSYESLSTCIEIALGMSKKMLESGMPHYCAIPVGGQLYGREIENLEDYEEWSNTIMGITLSKELGVGIKLFELEQMQFEYVKLIYLTVQNVSEKVIKIADTLVVTAICVIEDGDEVKTADKGQSQMIEIPISKVGEEQMTFFI